MNIKFRPHKRENIPLRVKWLNNPNVNKYVGHNPGHKTTLKKQTKWFDKYEKDKNKKFFTILDSKNPIGFMGLSSIDKINKSANLFIAIGDDSYRGKGIGCFSVKHLVEYGFEKLNLHKINLGVFTENKPAIKCYKMVGFVIEGTFKDDGFFGGKYHDLYSMAIFNKKK